MKTLMVAAMAIAACAMAGCTTPGAPPPPAAPVVAPPQPGAAGAEKVGAGSKAGFCTFKGADGKLYEAKC
jgi:hypothetical protein